MSAREFETGGLLINDATTHSGRWRAVTCLTDATFAAGTTCEDIAGTFTALQLSAGSLIAFY